MPDTHALLWRWADDPQLSATARAAIADRAIEVWVSAASAWEIATKQRLGKWPAVVADGAGFDRLLSASGLSALAVTSEHAWRAGTLPHGHRYPFDCMLAARSELEGLTLVTADGAFRSFQVHALC